MENIDKITNANTTNIIIFSIVAVILIVIVYLLVRSGHKLSIGKFSLSKENNIDYQLAVLRGKFHEDCSHYLDSFSSKTAYKFYSKEMSNLESKVANYQVFACFRRALIENGIEDKFPHRDATIQWLNKINDECFNRIYTELIAHDGIIFDNLKIYLESAEFANIVKDLEIQICTQLRDICVKYFLGCRNLVEKIDKELYKKYENKITMCRSYDISINDLTNGSLTTAGFIRKG